jgi:intein/homing endonuclease
MSMLIKSIKFNSRKEDVYDIETPTHDYVLSNGIISHNTQEMYSKAVVSGGCLIPGTRIKMFDDSLKNIEDVQVGDLVITLDGPKVVTHSWTPDTLEDGEPECFKITFEDGYEVICSDEHPFLINDRFVYAKELCVGDEITTIK